MGFLRLAVASSCDLGIEVFQLADYHAYLHECHEAEVCKEDQCDECIEKVPEVRERFDVIGGSEESRVDVHNQKDHKFAEELDFVLVWVVKRLDSCDVAHCEDSCLNEDDQLEDGSFFQSECHAHDNHTSYNELDVEEQSRQTLIHVLAK